MIPESKSNELEQEGAEQAEALDENTDEQSEDTQGAGEQSQDENSTDSFDPSTLTPELQKVYKQMQSDYTKKTQAVADDRKSADNLRAQYEEKLLQLNKLNQKPAEEKPLIDTSNMTAEQRQAWDLLDKHFDKKLTTIMGEKEKTYQARINQLQTYIGNMEWREFVKAHSDANDYRKEMADRQKSIGGNISLEELYVLVKGVDGLKKAGVDEYRKRVTTKKTAVTTKPSSTAGEEAEIAFDKGAGQRRTNLSKAFEAAKKSIGMR